MGPVNGLVQRGNVLYGPDGAPVMNKSRRRVRIGMRAATKGEVVCWDAIGSIVSGRHEVGKIKGEGEVIDGPDQLDRYTLLIKGAKVLVHVDSFVAHV